MSHALRTSFVLFAALAFAIPAAAQEVARPTPLVMAQLAPAVRLNAAVPSPEFALDASAPFKVAPNSQNVALIIVGSAGLVVGAVIGGDAGTLVMLAGGGVALWGLWRYLS